MAKRLLKNNLIKSEDINEQLELFDGKFLSKTEKVKHKMIGQLFNNYWLIEYNDSLYIVDQLLAVVYIP
jgi:DNA mismatch repair protein MutL